MKKYIIKKNKSKGFTLIELLAVIVILAVVMVVTIPTVIGSINKAKEKAFNTSVQAVQNYINKQIENCKMKNQLIAPYDETIFSDVNSCIIDSSKSNEIIEKAGYENELINMSIQDNIVLTVKGKENYESYNYLFVEEPDLSTGLVPIVYDKDHWEIADTSQRWYDYAKQEWANAASLTVSGKTKNKGDELDLNSDVYAMFVWIPRYSYTIGCKGQTNNINLTSDKCLGYKIEGASNLSLNTPGAIDIKFVSKNTKEKYDGYEVNIVGKSPTYNYNSDDDRTPTNWYTHPAFTFGDQELSGIWVGKFETSTATNASCYNSTSANCSVGETEIRILPNVISQRYQKLSNQFKYAQYLTMNNIYGLTGDAHMMKNSEWGAVVYLSQSIYGKYGNPNYEGRNKEIYINNSSGKYTGRSGGGVGGSTPINGTYTNQTNTTEHISYGFYTYDDYLLNYNTNTKGNKVEGKGTGASTTGNIYGIYDMSGGAFEYVMGNYNNTTSSSGFASTWFTEETNKKYFDKYTTTTPFTTKDKTTNGGALAETLSWYEDYKDSFSTSYTWLARGGFYSYTSNAGLFCGYTNDGGSNSISSFRVSFASTS